MKSPSHTLLLIPWHLGNRLDVTLNTVRAARRLRVFLAEDPALTRRQFESDLGLDCRGKEFLALPEEEDAGLAREVLRRLRSEDVGVISSGGVPCFVDPGAWLVERLAARGAAIAALAGASVLSTMLSLSGMSWPRRFSRGSFAVYPEGDGTPAEKEAFLEAVRRAGEPVFVFLAKHRFRDCLAAMRPALGTRSVTVFFDLTKVPRSRFPYADRRLTGTCAGWLRGKPDVRWGSVSEVALMVHPRGSRA